MYPKYGDVDHQHLNPMLVSVLSEAGDPASPSAPAAPIIAIVAIGLSPSFIQIGRVMKHQTLYHIFLLDVNSKFG